MGNSQGKESQPPSRGGHVRRSSAQVAAASPAGTSGPSGSSHERSGSGVGLYSARSGRGSRHDLSFLGIGGSSSQAERDPALEPRRETKAEREARKAFAAQEAEKALSEYEKAQRAFHANRERLKAERLAREAAASKTSSLRDS